MAEVTFAGLTEVMDELHRDAVVVPQRPAPTRPKPVVKSVSSELPKVQTLARKETLLRPDQREWLTRKAREVQRQRKGGERITDNTLIRLGVDLLMTKADRLKKGSTENELRRSLGI